MPVFLTIAAGLFFLSCFWTAAVAALTGSGLAWFGLAFQFFAACVLFGLACMFQQMQRTRDLILGQISHRLQKIEEHLSKSES